MQKDIASDVVEALPMWRASLPNRPLTGLTVLVELGGKRTLR